MLAIALTIGALLCATIAYAHGRRAGAREAEEEAVLGGFGEYRTSESGRREFCWRGK